MPLLYGLRLFFNDRVQKLQYPLLYLAQRPLRMHCACRTTCISLFNRGNKNVQNQDKPSRTARQASRLKKQLKAKLLLQPLITMRNENGSLFLISFLK